MAQRMPPSPIAPRIAPRVAVVNNGGPIAISPAGGAVGIGRVTPHTPLKMLKPAPGTSAKTPITTKAISMTHHIKKKQRPEVISPAAYLRAIFGSTGLTMGSPNSTIKAFKKPSEENIEAYDLDAVRAIRSKDLEKLRELHKNGKSMNACNQFGESLLHMACRRGDVPIVKYMILEARVNIQIRDDFGRTPFHDACWTSTPNFDVMDILMSVSNPYMLLAEDVRGSVPFDYARREHYDKWLRYLESRKEVIFNKLQQQHSQQQKQAQPSLNSQLFTISG